MTAERKLDAILELTRELIWIKDLDGNYLEASASLVATCGATREQIIGHKDYEFWFPAVNEECIRSDAVVIETGKPNITEEWIPGETGLRKYSVIKGPYYNEQGKMIGVVGIATDITNMIDEIKRTRRYRDALNNAYIEIDKLGRDPLSTLLLRGPFVHAVEKQLAELNGELKVMIMLDVDDFKEINDCYGHKVGDEVIAKVGDVLNQHFHQNDLCGRLGGDEFAIFLSDMPNNAIVEERVKVVLQALTQIPQEMGWEMKITCSMGVVSTRQRNLDFDRLYILADEALYTAKRNGKNQFVFSIKD